MHRVATPSPRPHSPAIAAFRPPPPPRQGSPFPHAPSLQPRHIFGPVSFHRTELGRVSPCKHSTHLPGQSHHQGTPTSSSSPSPSSAGGPISEPRAASLNWAREPQPGRRSLTAPARLHSPAKSSPWQPAGASLAALYRYRDCMYVVIAAPFRGSSPLRNDGIAGRHHPGHGACALRSGYGRSRRQGTTSLVHCRALQGNPPGTDPRRHPAAQLSRWPRRSPRPRRAPGRSPASDGSAQRSLRRRSTRRTSGCT